MFLVNWDGGKYYNWLNRYRTNIHTDESFVRESDIIEWVKRVVYETHPKRKDDTFYFSVENLITTIDDLWNTPPTKEQDDSSVQDQTESPSTNPVS